VPGSPAANAGLKLGDLVDKVGATKLLAMDELAHALEALPAGPVTLEVQRRGPPSDEPDGEPSAPTAITVTLNVPAPDPATSRMAQLGLGDAELVVAKVEPDSPAEKAGVQAGDVLVSAGGESFSNSADYATWLRFDEHPTAQAPLVVLRDGKELALTITPVMRTIKSSRSPRADEYPWDGIALWGLSAPPGVWVEKYSNPVQALAAGVRGTGEVIAINFRAFSKIFHHEISVRESVGGPIRIAQVAGAAAKAGAGAFIEVMVHLSVILGIMNLLPIPVLDGGHLAFFAMEAVLRRPPSLRVREVAQQVGMLLLLAVMMFVMVNDVVSTLF